MLLNSDTEVSPVFIKPLLDIFNLNKQIGAVQPLILNWSDKSTIWKYEGVLNKFFGTTSHKIRTKNFQSTKRPWSIQNGFQDAALLQLQKFLKKLVYWMKFFLPIMKTLIGQLD